MTDAALATPGGPVRSAGPRHDAELVGRLRKVTGQLSGVTRMVENERYCIDILDQLAAVTAAIDAAAVLVLSDHIDNCVREAIESGDAQDKVSELIAGVGRYVRSR